MGKPSHRRVDGLVGMRHPLDAVVKRAGSEMFINVPKLLVGQMPWSEPPSRACSMPCLRPRP